MAAAEQDFSTAEQEPTQAISPGADPYESRSTGRSDPMMVDPAVAAAAEFDPTYSPTSRPFVSWPPTPTGPEDANSPKPSTVREARPASNPEHPPAADQPGSSEQGENTSALITLGAQGQTVADPVEDIRGRRVHDKDGADIGKVTDLLIDTEQRKVRFLEVEHGGFLGLGAKASFIPVDAISAVNVDFVSIDQSGEHIAAAPGYDPDLQDVKSYYERVSDYYGYQPYWGMGYIYPGYPNDPVDPYRGGGKFQPGD